MPKPSKSSASSGTRKKHARKATAGADNPQIKIVSNSGKSGKRSKKSEPPRPKRYIPPTKPAPPRPDPLDILGLASILPPELVISLRNLGKKDSITKQRALQDLQSSWVDNAMANGEENTSIVESLDTMLPVWFHHFPALVIHSSKRVRFLAASLNSSMLGVPSLGNKMLYYLKEGLDSADIDANVGCWCISSFDIDPQVAIRSRAAWENVFIWKSSVSSKIRLEEHISTISDFLLRSISLPIPLYITFYPPPPPPPEPERKGSNKPSTYSSNEATERAPRTPEVEEENESDRQARMRCGAIGALKWILETVSPQDITIPGPLESLSELLSHLLADPLFWSTLYYGSDPPFDLDRTSLSPTYGCGQPLLRRMGWQLLVPLTEVWTDYLQPHMPLVSTAVLRSAWVEPDQSVQSNMWEPLLRFLTKNPPAWLLESQSAIGIADDDGGDRDDDDGNSDTHPESAPERHTEVAHSTVSTLTSPAYAEFLDFLRLGCNGSPVQGYPTVLVVLSTIPEPIRPSSYEELTQLFSAFWAAVDGRALGTLDRNAASLAFISSFLECLVFLVSRSWKEGVKAKPSELSSTTQQPLAQLITEQVEVFWSGYNSKALTTNKRAVSAAVAKFFQRLGDIDKGLLDVAWSSTSVAIKTDTQLLRETVQQLAPDGLARPLILQFVLERVHLLVSSLESSINEGISSILKGLKPTSVESPVNELADLIGAFDTSLDMETWKLIDELLLQHLHWLLQHAPVSSITHLISGYLWHREQDSVMQHFWDLLLETLSDMHPSTGAPVVISLKHSGRLPDRLLSRGQNIGSLTHSVLQLLLSENPPKDFDGLLFLGVVLENPVQFLQESTLVELQEWCIRCFISSIEAYVRTSTEPGVALNVSFSVLTHLAQLVQYVTLQGRFERILPELFVFAFLYSTSLSHPSDVDYPVASQALWETLFQARSRENQEVVLAEVRLKLRNMILQTTAVVSPALIVSAAGRTIQPVSDLLLEEVIPTRSEFENEFLELIIQPPEGSFEVLTVEFEATSSGLSYDLWGLSSYGRAIWGLLEVTEADREIGKRNSWILPHLLVFTTICLDRLKDSGSGMGVFGPESEQQLVRSLLQRSQKMTAYYLSLLFSDLPPQWHETVISSFKFGQNDQDTSIDASQLLRNAYMASVSRGRLQDFRVLRAILEALLKDASVNDAGAWIELSQLAQKESPSTSSVIMSVITGLGLDHPRLGHYRNELASKLSGVVPQHANSEGRRLLQLLIASAPSLESDFDFLPPQRAVFLLQMFQRWMASDEELDEAMDALLAHLFIYIVPIIQSIQGAHWDLIFDLIEANMENASFTRGKDLIKLKTSLQLLYAIDELSSTNKYLRSVWDARLTGVSELLNELLLERADINLPTSEARTDCRMLALEIAIRRSLVTDDDRGFPTLCSLLKDPSMDVKITAYQLLQTLVDKRTERFVMEAAIDSDGNKHELPLELLPFLHDIVPASEPNAPIEKEMVNDRLIASLLAWMVVFNFFANASLKLRNEYLEHLRNLGVVERYFLPGILTLLRVGSGPSQPKLGIWEIAEFHVELIDDSLEELPGVLAGHVYYRSLKLVPSLVRDWWVQCKDRQFSTAVGSLTGRYFSPTLIIEELAQLRSPGVAADLQDDAFSVKLSMSTHEVTVKYLIDEQPMEISIKLPSDFPLHGVELKDVRRVGVPEMAWRGWLLNVQKLSQSGMIVEALLYFKKNIALHFEGIVECAICYSIISATDQSMPKKPCRTCKNRFHASCLMKWFETSSLSTCPLCRSDIL